MGGQGSGRKKEADAFENALRQAAEAPAPKLEKPKKKKSLKQEADAFGKAFRSAQK